jgi:hypothetical protein
MFKVNFEGRVLRSFISHPKRKSRRRDEASLSGCRIQTDYFHFYNFIVAMGETMSLWNCGH